MRTVEDAIHIDAPVEVVWAVTEDVERWPEWTPTVTSVTRTGEGRFGLGSTARIRQPGQPEAEWTVTEFEPGRRFVWETRRTGLHMRGSHHLEAQGSGTLNRLAVEVGGVGGALLWPILRRLIRGALVRENEGLKARCEAESARNVHETGGGQTAS